MARKSPKLTTAKRKRLSGANFALPSKKAYPIDTIGRARNALARAAQQVKKGNLTRAQEATIRRKVLKKYPSIDKGKKKK